MAAQRRCNRKGPVELDGTVAACAAAQGVAQHQGVLRIIGNLDDLHITAAHVVADVGIVVLANLQHAPPRPQQQRPVFALQAKRGGGAVPAARQRIAAPVGLVHQAEAEHACLPAQNIEVGAEDELCLRLVTGFAKRPRIAFVEDLPVRNLGVAHPQIAVVAEQVVGQLGLQADLVFQFAAIDALRAGHGVFRRRRARRLVAAGGIEGHQVDRPERADAERGRLGILGRVGIQLPARIEERTWRALVTTIGVAERLVGKHIGRPHRRERTLGRRLAAYRAVIAGQARSGLVDARAGTRSGTRLIGMDERRRACEEHQQHGLQRARHRRNPDRDEGAW